MLFSYIYFIKISVKMDKNGPASIEIRDKFFLFVKAIKKFV